MRISLKVHDIISRMSTEFERHPLRYFARNLSIVVGLVLIWRGIWYLLDGFDLFFLGGSHTLSAAGGIIVGLLILFLPDRDLKEIQKL